MSASVPLWPLFKSFVIVSGLAKHVRGFRPGKEQDLRQEEEQNQNQRDDYEPDWVFGSITLEDESENFDFCR